jgi:hypothetical protein
VDGPCRELGSDHPLKPKINPSGHFINIFIYAYCNIRELRCCGRGQLPDTLTESIKVSKALSPQKEEEEDSWYNGDQVIYWEAILLVHARDVMHVITLL